MGVLAKDRHGGIPRWNGDESLEGKRVLLWCAESLGDTLQFCRYGPLLAQRGAHVVVEVQPALKAVVDTLDVCEAIARGEPLPAFDFQVPLESLPLAFRTTLETIPSATPYLKLDPPRVRAWRDRIPRTRDMMSVGIACSRDLALGEFEPLRDVAHLVLIQQDVGAEDAAYLQLSGIDQLDASFEDSAAIMANVDVVVCADTPLAHLAGALAVPVWILLPGAADRRWLEDRDDSPWYPTATLYRQERGGGWDEVMVRVREALIAARR